MYGAFPVTPRVFSVTSGVSGLSPQSLDLILLFRAWELLSPSFKSELLHFELCDLGQVV